MLKDDDELNAALDEELMRDEQGLNDELEQDWYFTFGCGQRHAGCYTVIRGTHASARQEMHRRYGDQWSMQYPSAEAVGVEKWELKEVR